MHKQALVLKHLEEHGSITARELTGKPFYLNCPHRAICNLRKQKHEINDRWSEKIKTIKNQKGKTITKKEKFKVYFMEA